MCLCFEEHVCIVCLLFTDGAFLFVKKFLVFCSSSWSTQQVLPLSPSEPSISRMTCRRSASGARFSWNISLSATSRSARASRAESAIKKKRNFLLTTNVIYHIINSKVLYCRNAFLLCLILFINMEDVNYKLLNCCLLLPFTRSNINHQAFLETCG